MPRKMQSQSFSPMDMQQIVERINDLILDADKIIASKKILDLASGDGDLVSADDDGADSEPRAKQRPINPKAKSLKTVSNIASALRQKLGDGLQCAACAERATMRCTVCKTAYCCAACQRKHWPTHKYVCVKRDVL